jgi:hypothetical protein
MVKAPNAPALFIGLSTDAKPIAQQKTGRLSTNPQSVGPNIPYGALLYATDTAKWFVFEGASQLWLQLAANPV